MRTTKKGCERLRYIDFYLSLLAAKGIPLIDDDEDDEGRELSYASQIQLNSGDGLQIKVVEGNLQLVAIVAAASAPAEDGESRAVPAECMAVSEPENTPAPEVVEPLEQPVDP